MNRWTTPQRETAKKLAGEHYGEANVDLTDLGLIIKMGDFFIKNSNDFELKIKGFYFIFYTGGALGCFREKMSLSEAKVGYWHSHYSHDDKLNSNSKFCLGNTPIAVSWDVLLREFNETEFEKFLFLLDSYLRWESLEGGPYKSMAKVINESLGKSIVEPLIGFSMLLSIFKKWKIFIQSNKYNLIVNNDNNIVSFIFDNNEEFNNSLKEQYPNCFIHYNQFNEPVGTESNISSMLKDVQAYNSSFKTSSYKSLFFKDNLIICKVEEPNPTKNLQENILTLKLSRPTQKRIYSHINTQIQNEFTPNVKTFTF